MSTLRTCSLSVLGSLALLIPVLPASAQTFEDCRLLRRSLSRQMQELKDRQSHEMAQCDTANGRHSQTCNDLKERQKEDMRQLNVYRLSRLRGCNEPFAEYPHYFHQFRYQNAVYEHKHRHKHDSDHDGHHHKHHDRDYAARESHGQQGTHSPGSRANLSAHSSVPLGHMAGGGTWQGGNPHIVTSGYSGGHLGSTGGGSSAGHGSGYNGGGSSSGHSSGSSGGGSYSGGSGGGYSGGHSGGSSGGGSYSGGGGSSGSSSSGSGGHVKTN